MPGRRRKIEGLKFTLRKWTYNLKVSRLVPDSSVSTDSVWEVCQKRQINFHKSTKKQQQKKETETTNQQISVGAKLTLSQND